MRFVADFVKSRGHGRARIGVELDAYYYTARGHMVLMSSLPNATEIDATGLVNRVRIVKSADEIRLLRDAAVIAERAMDVAVDGIEPGNRQNDAVAEIYRAQIRGTAEFRRRLHRHCTHSADRCGHIRTSSDVERPSVPEWRGNNH